MQFRLMVSVLLALLLAVSVVTPPQVEAKAARHKVIIKVDGRTQEVVTKHTKGHNVLHSAGIRLEHHDEFRMSTPHITDGTVITVYRAVHVTLEAHGKKHEFRAASPTVGELLEKHGYPLSRYSSNPDPSTELKDGMHIKVETLEEHERRLAEEARLKEERNPGPGYVKTEQGYLRFTEHYVMEGTAYMPEDGNGDGITAIGIPAHYGVVAVDPEIIELGTRVYIPGYGVALAADTGGAIDGMIIDLCMESYDECMEFGRRDVDVYVLAN